MSLIKSIRAQLGLSNTAANNFVWDASADNGSCKLARGNAGATTQDLITVSASNVITGASGAVLVGNGPAFSARKTGGNQSVTSATPTKVTLNTEDFDTANCFSSDRFTPNVAGYYQINGSVYGSAGSMTQVQAYIYKNGSSVARTFSSAATSTISVSCLVYMNGSTDYLEMYGSVTGTSPVFGDGGGDATQFSGFLARSA